MTGGLLRLWACAGRAVVGRLAGHARSVAAPALRAGAVVAAPQAEALVPRLGLQVAVVAVREAGVVAGPAFADHALPHVLPVLCPAFRDVHVAKPLALQVPHPARDGLARDTAAQGGRRVVE